MTTVQRRIRSGYQIAFAAITVSFLVTRLVSLDRLPIFIDEAIHIKASLRMATHGGWLGHVDAGKYLPIWIYRFVAAGTDEPLWWTRASSAGFGFAGLLGIGILGYRLGDLRAGLLAQALWVASPWTLINERMALADSLLTALVVYALVFGFLWIDTERTRWAAVLGFAIGLTGITKLYGVLLIPLPLALIALKRPRRRLCRQLPIAYACTLVLYLPLFLERRTHFGYLQSKLPDTLLAGGWPAHGFEQIMEASQTVGAWAVAYLTLPGVGIVAAAMIGALARRAAGDLLLLGFSSGWTLLFLVAAAIGADGVFSRYLLPAIPALLLLAGRLVADASDTMRRRWGDRAGPLLPLGVVALIAAWSVPFHLALILDPARTPMPPDDREQYIEEFSAGFGIVDAAAFLRKERTLFGTLLVVRAPSEPLVRDGLDIYLQNEPQIAMADVEAAESLLEAITAHRAVAGPREVFYVEELPSDAERHRSLGGVRVELAASFAKPGGLKRVDLYRVGGSLRRGGVAFP